MNGVRTCARKYVVAVVTAALVVAGVAMTTGGAADPVRVAEDRPAALLASRASLVAKETGISSVNHTADAYQVMGTDLGIMWDDGRGRTLTAFGDTFGQGWIGPGGKGSNRDWRSNTLATSTDRNLADGMHFDSMVTDRPGHAKELLYSKKISGQEMTVIPTGAVSVGARQYMAYMSVKQWSATPGEWDTNYSGMAYSDDGGRTWVKDAATRWANTGGNDPFQMIALAHRDGYVYAFGTPDGRSGAAHVARVPEKAVLNKAAYQYWTGLGWSTGADSQAAGIVGSPVAELSVMYNNYTGRWLMSYLDASTGDIMLRQASTPSGPWQTERVLASQNDYPDLYGGFLHPWSSGPDLYFTLSEWGPYNVYLMRVSLTGGPGNLAGDPSFEQPPDGRWTCVGTCGTDVGLRNSYSGADNAWARGHRGWQDVHQSVPVAANTTYRLSGWLRTSENSDSGYFGVRTPNGVVLGQAHYTKLRGYQRVTLTVRSGSNTRLDVYGGVWTDHGDIWLQMDDVSLDPA
jgi:hypothetical protein